MFKKLWLGFLFLLVLVSLTLFIAVDTVAYPNPFSCTGNTDSSLTLAQGLAPPVMDKTYYDAKMANGFCSANRQYTMVLIRNTNQSANVGSEDTIIINLPVTDMTEGGRQNVQSNQFTTGTQGDLEVTHPDVLVCESLATYGYYTTQNFAKKNGQNIDVKHRSPLPEVVYIGDKSGPGDGEASFAITCASLAFASDIGDPVYQASRPAFQTRYMTPEVVYLGKQSLAGDSNYLPKLGNEFAVVCEKLLG